MELIRPELVGHNRDVEGFYVYYCPECFSCDNIHMREDRRIQKSINTANAIFSLRMRKKVVFALTKNNGFKNESERKIFIVETNEQLKGISDNYCCKELSNIFCIPIAKVVSEFYKIKRQRGEFPITEYSVDKRIQ